MADVPIPDFLAELGLTGAAAERARAVLEAEGITNPRKSRLSPAKLDAARAAIDARFARFCAPCAARTDAGGREVVIVAAASCSRCGGSRNDRALTEMVEACAAAGVRRLVVVGGSPDVRREFGAVVGGPDLRLVDGTKRRTRSRGAARPRLGRPGRHLRLLRARPTRSRTSTRATRGRRRSSPLRGAASRRSRTPSSSTSGGAEPSVSAIWRRGPRGRSLEACSASADPVARSNAVTATPATSSLASKRSPKPASFPGCSRRCG